MYKLMLVDDEAIARKNVINKIHWNEYGFEIVCEAENGEEAFEMFETYLPDVVITDIKMPFMNGLQLSEKILKKYPFTKIIVLTGFDEFEYAKKGVDLHVMNYILKPITSKELIKILKEVKEKLDLEIRKRRDFQRLKEYYDKSYPLMKDKFLEALVKGEYVQEDIYKWLDYYKVDLKGKMFLISVIKIDNFYKERKNINFEETEFKKISLLNMVTEVNSRNNIGIFFLMNNHAVVISKTNKTCEREFIQETILKLEEIRQGVEKFLQFTVTIGVGHVCNNLSDIQSSLKSALNAYDYKLAMGNNQVIYINDLEEVNNEDFELSEIQQRQLMRILKVGSKEDFFKFTDEIFNKIAKHNGEENERQIFILELFTIVLKTAKEMKIDLCNVYEDEVNLFNIMEKFNQLEYSKNTFNSIGEKIIECISEGRKNTEISIISKAKAYVKENYTDCDFNIDKLSKYLHYSPNYFSTVFKKETGEAFMNYLLDIRIEAAKDLLLTTDMKTLEIALEVGFASPNYFSFCFKKKMNISPSKYRKTNKLA